MLKTALGLLAGMILTASASAQTYTQQQIGRFDYTTGPNGYYGSGQQIGRFHYYHDSEGNSVTSQQIGRFRYYTITRSPAYGIRHYGYTNPYGND